MAALPEAVRCSQPQQQGNGLNNAGKAPPGAEDSKAPSVQYVSRVRKGSGSYVAKSQKLEIIHSFFTHLINVDVCDSLKGLVQPILKRAFGNMWR